nr:YtpI family protein [Mammaliicoccus sp. Marseille-Q6498]
MSPVIMSTLVALSVTIMILALIFAILNLARSFRTKREVRKAYHKERARFYFGIFMIAFSADQVLLFPTLVTYIVVLVLLFFGIINITYGHKASKYFKGNLPIENKAWDEFEQKKRNQSS